MSWDFKLIVAHPKDNCQPSSCCHRGAVKGQGRSGASPFPQGICDFWGKRSSEKQPFPG